MNESPTQERYLSSPREVLVYQIEKFLQARQKFTCLGLEILFNNNKHVQLINSDKGPDKRGLAFTSKPPPLKPILQLDPLVRSYPHGGVPTESNIDPKNVSARTLKILRSQILERSIIRATESLAARSGPSNWNGETYKLAIKLFLACVLDPNYSNMVYSLTSHTSNIHKTSHLGQELELYVENLLLAIDIIDADSVLSKKGTLLEDSIRTLVHIMAVNYATVIIGDSPAQFFDITFALINHSCFPNVLPVVLDDCDKIQLVYFNNFVANKTKQLFTNYCYTAIPKELRNADLRNRFFFTCNCWLCKQPHDIFFSYNCNNCNQMICSLNSSNWYLPVSQLDYVNDNKDTCLSCRADFDKRELAKNHSLNGYLLLAMLDPEQDKDDNEALLVFNHRMKLLLQSIISGAISKEEIVRLLLLRVYNFRIPPKKRSIFRKITNDLRNGRYVPGYGFPLSFFLRDLDIDNPQIDGIRTFVASKVVAANQFTRLKEVLQLKFGTELPCRLVELRLIANEHFKEIAQALSQVFSYVVRLRYSGCIPVKIGKSPSEQLTVLIKCSLFFYLQAIETYMAYSKNTVDSLVDSIKRLISLADNNKIDNICFKRYNMTDHYFQSHLKALYDFAEVQVKKNKIDFANRNRGAIFVPIGELKCLDEARIF